MTRRVSTGVLLIAALGLVLVACGAPSTPGEPRVLSVSIDQTDMTLEVDQTTQLSATVAVVGGVNDAVLWGSDAPDVATVDADGLVTAVAAGEATITATSVFDANVSDAITVEVVGGVDFVVDAQGETRFPTPRVTFDIGAGERVVIEVDFPSSAADLMYVEIEPNETVSALRIELRGQTGVELELVSRSPSIFAANPAALPAAATTAGVDRSSLSVEWNCFGPCAARPYRSGTSIVHVVNEGSVSRSVTFYAYGFVAADENEPNDTIASATPVLAEALEHTVAGAIEHVDDRDYFQIACDAAFPFDNIRLELTSSFEGEIVLFADGVTYAPGVETPTLPCGSTVFVHTTDDTAGPSAHSRYTVTIR